MGVLTDKSLLVSTTSAIHAELQQILESRWLRESAQLSSLLQYVVSETLAGRVDSIKEYSLGREVFHRPPHYDPRTDAIVRVQASLLRKRLASYYENEGRDSRVRIDLPRGGYVPTFTEVAVEVPEPALPAPAVTPASREAPAPGPNPRGGFWAGLVVGVLMAVFAGLALLYVSSQKKMPGPAVWGSFVRPGVESIVSFGVPLFYAGGGVFARDPKVNRIGDEVLGRFLQLEKATGARFQPQEDVYTGIGDLVGTHEVVRWLEGYGVQTRLANSRYLGQSDIAPTNLVVVSSSRFQTLLSEMALPSLITFNDAGPGGFHLQNPGPGEQEYYEARSGTGVETSYAVLSLWPGKQSGLRILNLSGISTWVTQGAAQYVVNREKLGMLQARLEADPPTGPHGRKGPFFQVLLRVEGKNNSVRTAEYVTHRYLSSLH